MIRNARLSFEGGIYGSTSVVVVDATSVGDAGVCEMDGMGDIEVEVRACTSAADDVCDGS